MKCPNCGGSEYPSDNQTVFQEKNGKMMCLICNIEVKKRNVKKTDPVEESANG